MWPPVTATAGRASETGNRSGLNAAVTCTRAGALRRAEEADEADTVPVDVAVGAATDR